MARTIDIKKVAAATVVTVYEDAVISTGASINETTNAIADNQERGLMFPDNPYLDGLQIRYDNLTSATNSLMGGAKTDNIALLSAFATLKFFQEIA